jgi:hypothetical protein
LTWARWRRRAWQQRCPQCGCGTPSKTTLTNEASQQAGQPAAEDAGVGSAGSAATRAAEAPAASGPREAASGIKGLYASTKRTFAVSDHLLTRPAAEVKRLRREVLLSMLAQKGKLPAVDVRGAP